MAASRPYLLAAYPKPVPPVPSDVAEPDPLIGVSDPDSGLSGSAGGVEPPLTSEPPLVAVTPLTSEPPLSPEPPLTSEPTARAAAGTDAEPTQI